jgi:transcriptional regulator with XRE-family HTH domain
MNEPRRNRVLEIRKKKNISQIQLAVRAIVSVTTIARVEKYHFQPALETERKIARALGVAIKEAFPFETLA